MPLKKLQQTVQKICARLGPRVDLFLLRRLKNLIFLTYFPTLKIPSKCALEIINDQG
jgi:hypothetical protein